MKFLTSYRFAFYIIAGLLLSLVTGVVVFPDQSPVQQTFWFIGLLGILVASLGVCTYRRVSTEFRAYRASKRELTGEPGTFASNVILPSPYSPAITRDLLRRDSRLRQWGKARQFMCGDFLFEKGRAGVWGSILFHCGLMVVILGIGASLSFGIRGMFALTEGEAAGGDVAFLKNISMGILSDRSVLDRFEVSLVQFDKGYRVGPSTTPACRLKISDDGHDVLTTIHVNNGFEGRNGTLFIGDNWGFSPRIDIRDTSGIIIFSGFLRLATTFRDGNPVFSDRIELESGRTLSVEFFPALRISDSVVSSTGTDLINPYISLSLAERDSVLVQEYVAVNRNLLSGDLILGFPQVRHWAQFEFVHDPAIPLLYSGFSLALLGLCVRLLFVKRKMMIIVSPNLSGSTITLSGWTEKYKNALREDLSACEGLIRETLGREIPHAVPTSEIRPLNLAPQE